MSDTNTATETHAETSNEQTGLAPGAVLNVSLYACPEAGHTKVVIDLKNGNDHITYDVSKVGKQALSMFLQLIGMLPGLPGAEVTDHGNTVH